MNVCFAVMEHLSPRLREIVRQSVALLGEVIRLELGEEDYRLIEGLRVRMAELRGRSVESAIVALKREREFLRGLSSEQGFRVAQTFTLMLELMNACENAYRTTELGHRKLVQPAERPDSVIYVLTAHPTEARAPGNISLFHEMLRILAEALGREDVRLTTTEVARLKFYLSVSLKTSVVRPRRPRVRDEAEHIYATLLRDETLRPLLRASEELAPVYIRSWVGGDKDGHPGVDEKTFRESLGLSRAAIVGFCARRLSEVRTSLGEGEPRSKHAARQATEALRGLGTKLRALRSIDDGDGARVTAFRKTFADAFDKIGRAMGPVPHPSLLELKRLLRVFPALVVPLEFRESSDILMSGGKRGTKRGKLAIDRMLASLAKISRGTEPVWYVRGFIISQANQIEHLETAAALIRRNLGVLKLPVIPLFEQLDALEKAPSIVREMLKKQEFASAIKKLWGLRLEVMLGYSDSSKECGVMKSRLAIAETMHAIERLCTREKITPIFFQGSGGSTDRGGGTIPEQTSWWSSGALRNYKVTVQGEMVERSLASPEITRGQIERIVQSAGRWKEVRGRKLPDDPVLEEFAERVAERYKTTVRDPRFLAMVERATPYPYLSALKFGSRPAARAQGVSLKALRAIPWILCWTQTRVLFPTWWGVGSAWKSLTPRQQKKLVAASKGHPVFATFVRALGFTLARIELPVWNLYLESSTLPSSERVTLWNEFVDEHRGAMEFARAMLGPRELIPWRPWLAESIHLRSAMIHPINLLQLIAMERGDIALLRLTVAGVSSGMMTTG